MKEYIIHGTSEENLLKILKDGSINTIHKGSKGLLNKSEKNIFTQLSYKNLPNQENQIPHWMDSCIVLDKKILKDYAFYGTRIGGFTEKFNNAFLENTDGILVKGNGNVKKMPNLSKLKKHMEEKMERNSLGIVSFIHSNEILFNKNIPLIKYCIYIIMRGYEIVPEKIKKLGNKLNIPIKNYQNPNKYVGLGINNFIDLIEKK